MKIDDVAHRLSIIKNNSMAVGTQSCNTIAHNLFFVSNADYASDPLFMVHTNFAQNDLSVPILLINRW